MAMRVMVDAVGGQLDQLIVELEPAKAVPNSCAHPLDKRKYEGDMGSASFKCEQCGMEFKQDRIAEMATGRT